MKKYIEQCYSLLKNTTSKFTMNGFGTRSDIKCRTVSTFFPLTAVNILKIQFIKVNPLTGLKIGINLSHTSLHEAFHLHFKT